MKVLKILGIIILVLVVLVIVLGLIAPKKYAVERAVIINAPKELVFNHVVNFRNWNVWSPWAEKDSTMTVTIEGTDGEQGAVYKWVGDPKITGSGEISNTGVKQNEEMAYHLHFIKPWESHSDGYNRVADAETGCKASWGMYGKNPFPWNILSLFMNMDKMIGPDFERGLNLLKEICEKEAEQVAVYDIKEVVCPATKYVAVQKELSFDEIESFFGYSFGLISRAMTKNKAQFAGAPVGLYYSWNEQLNTTDVAAAFPSTKAVSEGDIKTIELPAGKAYFVDYYGAYEGVGPAHLALDLFLKKNNLQQKSPVIEEYITDPEAEPDTSKWLTKIYYFVE